MNYTRIVLAAAAATIVDAIYGFIVWGHVFQGEFSRYPEIYREGNDVPDMLLMFAGVFVAMCVASWIYTKGYEGRGGLTEGLTFGIVMGLLLGAYFSGVSYGIMRIGKKLALAYAIGEFGEWFVAGLTIGLVSRPAAAVKRTAGV